MSDLDLRQAILPDHPSRGVYGRRIAEKHAAKHAAHRRSNRPTRASRRSYPRLGLLFTLFIAIVGGPIVFNTSSLKLIFFVHLLLVALPFSAFREIPWSRATRIVGALLLGPILVVVFWTTWFIAMLGGETAHAILSAGPQRAWAFVIYAMDLRTVTIASGPFQGIYQQQTLRLIWIAIAGLICAAPLIGAILPRHQR